MWSRSEAKVRRHRRIRRKVVGTAERPRLAVFRSARHVSVQVVDDGAGRTLAHATSCEKEVRVQRAEAKMKKTAVAEAIGKRIAERCKALGISAVVFDRGGCRYHGRIAAVAKGAREGGLSF